MFASCHKDVNDDNLNSVTETQITVPYTFNEIEGTLVGYVYGENGQPISDASVSIYSTSTSTNEYGVFQFSDVKMDGQGTLVNVSKDGYIDGADFVYPNDEGSGTARLKLIEFSPQGTFNSTEGGAIAFADNGQVTFGPNSIRNLDGSIYSGTVAADIRSNYPSDVLFNDEFLGGFIGTDIEGGNSVLGAIGSVSILTQKVGGGELQIASQQTYTIKFPIEQSQLSIAKEEIAVWKYNTTSGYWDEVGVARNEGGFYVIEVSEVGSFIFAEPYGITHYCAKLVDEADLPVKNYIYNIYVEGKVCAKGISDNDGFICSKLPMGENLELRINHPVCNEVIKSIDVGPLDEPNNGGNIVIETVLDIRSGVVECNGEPVADAAVIVKTSNGTIIQTTDGSGGFILNVNDAKCSPNELFEVLAMKGGDFSPVLEIGTSSTSDIKLDVCKTDCDYTVSFSYDNFEACISGAFDAINVQTVGGSGQFNYSWNDGSNGVSNSSLVSGSEFCVTVTDLSSGCVVSHCETVEEYRTVELIEISSYNGSCTQNGGVIELEVSGGEKPYDYKWSSSNGYNSNIPNPTNLWPGVYNLTLTDANDCEIFAEVEVFDVTVPIDSETTEECDFSTITILEAPGYGPFNYLWEWEGGSSSSISISIFNPGEYSVTRTDQNNCSRTKSFTISSVGAGIDLNYNSNCIGGSVLYNVSNLDYQYFYETLESGGQIDVSHDGGEVDISILESGYRYYFGAKEVSSECESKIIVELPHFEGLQIENVENTSCGTCNDGNISVFLDTNEDCSGGCVTGEVIIISKLTGAEVTSLNNENQLTAGNYIVIVIDENTGCYIAHEEVIVE